MVERDTGGLDDRHDVRERDALPRRVGPLRPEEQRVPAARPVEREITAPRWSGVGPAMPALRNAASASEWRIVEWRIVE